MRALVILLAALTTSFFVPSVAASDTLPTGTRVEGNCVWVYDFPDAGYAICKGRADCPAGLYTRQVTFIGEEEKCLL